MKMPYGGYRDEEFEDIPSDYIEWISKNWDESTPRNKEICKAADDEYQFRTKYNCHF